MHIKVDMSKTQNIRSASILIKIPVKNTRLIKLTIVNYNYEAG